MVELVTPPARRRGPVFRLALVALVAGVALLAPDTPAWVWPFLVAGLLLSSVETVWRRGTVLRWDGEVLVLRAPLKRVVLPLERIERLTTQPLGRLRSGPMEWLVRVWDVDGRRYWVTVWTDPAPFLEHVRD